MRVASLIFLCLIALLIAEVKYGKTKRQEHAGGSIGEAFIRKGNLGELLSDAGFLSIAPESSELASNNMCASNSELKGFDYDNSLRIRVALKLDESYRVLDGDGNLINSFKSRVNVTVNAIDTVSQKRETKTHQVHVDPKQDFYELPLRLMRNQALSIDIRLVAGTPLRIDSVSLDGRYGRSEDLEFVGDAPTKISFLSVDSSPNRVYTLGHEKVNALLKGGFPGKKNRGYCRYVATKKFTSLSKNDGRDFQIPQVSINAKPDLLHGPNGIFQNKLIKGRAGEVVASLSTRFADQQHDQAVGLRFHGGGPGRKKDINSYRLYARQDYGKDTIPYAAIFVNKRAKDLKTVVFKYTYQAYFDQIRNDFNPFNHALALDIARSIGALVPAHGLVDLYLNSKREGVFLAMEHLSNRSVENWLGHDDFTTVSYKKASTHEERVAVTTPMNKILASTGNDALQMLKRFYDVNNVINSVLLSAYIADDDACQGMEVIDHRTNTLFSFNWDIDHAFLKWSYKKKKLRVTAKRPGYFLVHPKMTRGCTRAKVYSWVYVQSPQFRAMLRERLLDLLNNELSVSRIDALLDYYRNVNKAYYGGKQSRAIESLLKYANERPAILLKELDKLEHYVKKNS